MQKNMKLLCLFGKQHRKILKIMRVTLFVLLVGTFQVLAGSGYSQNARLSLHLQGASVREVLGAIEAQSEFYFLYNSELIDVQRKVDLTVENETIDQILSRLFPNNEVKILVRDRHIILTPAGKTVQQPGQEIKGTVRSTTGELLPGVSILIKGTSVGTVTDANGNFSLNKVRADETLVVSFIGMRTQEIGIAGRTFISIVMEEESIGIEEVVAVGYGVQKKVNLTGAVAVVTAEDLASRPVTAVSTGLQGLLPGVTVVNSTGLPGQSTGTIRVRGLGTIGNSNPLVLIDGVEGNINILNPEDIESVSVLKDAASAAIYGARGANGVILVTTKSISGKEMKPEVNFNGYFGLQMPTSLPEMVSSMEYIEMDNEARANVGLPSNYPDDAIERIIQGTDPDYYNNTDWVNAIYRDAAPQQNYSVSVNGKSPLMGYYLSYSYLDQDGLTVGSTTNSLRHNLRAKINTLVANFIDITANMGYTSREYETPSSDFDSGGGAIYTAMRISPVIPERFQDGSWGYGGGSANPVALLYDSGQNKFKSQEFSGNFTGKVDLIKGWNASATYSFIQSNSYREILSKTINYYRPGTDEIWYSTNPTNKFDVRDYTSIKQTLIAQSNYERSFGKHQLSAIAGFSQEWYTEKNFTAQRINLTTEYDPSLEYGALEGMSNSASASTWAIRSGFGRVNYNFDNRYLFEANLRYDLSSRFHKDERDGLFPSFSAGWRLSEENFMDKFEGIFDNLKLRGSWGILGNQYVGSSEYPYMSVLGSVAVPNIGTGANVGYTQTSLPNPALHWETITMTNIGVDMTILNNRLNMTADWFVKNTDDILLKLTYPGVLGLTPTEENVGSVRNTGWEIDLRWNDKIGRHFTYGVAFNLSDVKNKITDFGGLQPSIGSYNIKRVGDPIDAFYGLVAEELAMPWDFDHYDPAAKRYVGPKFPILDADAGLVQPGDIKYRDLSGPNGTPDGKITLDNDRKVVGSSIPRYTFNFRGDMGWKGIDFNFTLQGVGKADGYLEGAGRHTFIDQSAYPQKVHRGRWTTENPDPNAAYPRFTANYSYNQRFSTFWLENAAYLRLKNVQLGYTLQKSVTDKLKIDKCRFYVSADNLLTFTDFFDAYDPETPVSSGGYYPQVKTVVLGFNITLK